FYPIVGIGSVKPNPVKRGATLYVVGTMAPASLGEKPVLQVFGSNEAWHTVATAYGVNSSGVWSLRWLVPTNRHAGTIQVRAILPATGTHFQGTSSSRSVTIL